MYTSLPDLKVWNLLSKIPHIEIKKIARTNVTPQEWNLYWAYQRRLDDRGLDFGEAPAPFAEIDQFASYSRRIRARGCIAPRTRFSFESGPAVRGGT
jgi:hypothetical protein